MISDRTKSTLRVAVAVIATGSLFAGNAHAATAPIKEIVSSHIGAEVDEVTKENICTIKSGHKCVPGKPGGGVGEFDFPSGVAGVPGGGVYVTEKGNHRVVEFDATGKFVLMFGKEVNATTKGDICTQVEIETVNAKCKEGVVGEESGAFSEAVGVAVDPSGKVYVADPGLERVDEYDATGKFLLMFGKEVNATTKGNICKQTEVEAKTATCKTGVFTGLGVTEHGVFVVPEDLAVGPANHLLYVGDEHRVQEFNAEGEWVAEIRTPLEKISLEEHSDVTSLAVDQTGQVYLAYKVNSAATAIYEFDATGNQINEFVGPSGAQFSVKSIALDPAGRLAVLDNGKQTGVLYEVGVTGLRVVTEFPEEHTEQIAFDGQNNMYAVAKVLGQELITYNPVSVGELVVTPAKCIPGAEHETNTTFDCELTGEVDPWGVSETMVWFEWGRTPSFGEITSPPIPVANSKGEGEEEPYVKVNAPIVGVRPNETFYDELVGEDHQVKHPEKLSSPLGSFITPSVPPKIIGEPTVGFVRPSSVVMFGNLNPENTLTNYRFQYAPTDSCPSLETSCAGILESDALESPVYGEIEAALEATGLRSATKYLYRLAAINEKGQEAVNQAGGPQLPESEFETAPAPVVSAITGEATSVTTTSALLQGTVNPDGQPSTYTFEMGIYKGTNTQYGIVFSASAGQTTTSTEETLSVTGLQPGTTYAYRISIHFGDGTTPGASATGTTSTFSTQGSPEVLKSPPTPQTLPTPKTQFPKPKATVTNKTKNKPKHKKQKQKKSNTQKHKPHKEKK